jgi:hypothetical protein
LDRETITAISIFDTALFRDIGNKLYPQPQQKKQKRATLQKWRFASLVV